MNVLRPANLRFGSRVSLSPGLWTSRKRSIPRGIEVSQGRFLSGTVVKLEKRNKLEFDFRFHGSGQIIVFHVDQVDDSDRPERDLGAVRACENMGTGSHTNPGGDTESGYPEAPVLIFTSSHTSQGETRSCL